jgi:hypothetical protein
MSVIPRRGTLGLLPPTASVSVTTTLEPRSTMGATGLSLALPRRGASLERNYNRQDLISNALATMVRRRQDPSPLHPARVQSMRLDGTEMTIL